MAGVWDTIKDYAVPDILVDEVKRARLNSATVKARNAAQKARRATLRAREATGKLKGTGGLSVHRPATVVDAAYDTVGKGYAALRRATGSDERTAVQAGQGVRDNLAELGKMVTTLPLGAAPEEIEKSIARSLSGEGDVTDNLTALTVLAPGPTGRLAVGAAKGVGKLARAVTPNIVKRGLGVVGAPVGRVAGRVADKLLPTGAIEEATHFIHGGNEVYHPGTTPDDLRVVHAPPPRVSARPEASAPRVVGTPSLAARPAPLALPSPETATPLKPRGRQWLPDVDISLGPADAKAGGWTVRDRGEHADPGNRYQTVMPGGLGARTFPSEEAAWASANRASVQAPINYSPERAARVASNAGYVHWGMEDDPTNWLEKSLAKYYKRDFGTENDPLLELAGRGLHYNPDMTPEGWQRVIDDSLAEDPAGYYTVPRHASGTGASAEFQYDPVMGPAVTAAAPWLAKNVPATDPVLGVKSPLDLDHFMDEFAPALKPDSPLPPDLRINPASLNRMSFPQAVERVGKINQWRANNMAEASLAAQANPAIRTHKEYPDDPLGLRWVELRAPDLPEDMAGYRIEPADNTFGQGQPGHIIYGPDGEEIGAERTVERAQATIRDKLHRQNLSEALRYEGDTMGHCVGGYCDDVMRGDSRIFSLRDAKGAPHVTIETSPGRTMDWLDAVDEIPPLADAWNRARYGANAPDPDLPFNHWLQKHEPDLYAQHEGVFAPKTDRIVQIKGKQNDAPADKYLPHVQDFVKSGDWSAVDELGNASLVRLPDGRYLDEATYEGLASELDDRFNGWNFRDFPRNPQQLDADDWAQFSRHFEGYAYGGRVEKDRNWARGPLAVY